MRGARGVTTPPRAASDECRKRHIGGAKDLPRGAEEANARTSPEERTRVEHAQRRPTIRATNRSRQVANRHRWVPSRVLRGGTNEDFQTRTNPEWKSLYSVEGEFPNPLADRARCGEVCPSMLITRTHPRMGTGERCHGVKARLDECTHTSGMRYGV